MAKHLILIHGRSFKPAEEFLRDNWLKALRLGLERDHDDETVAAYDAVAKRFVYYGDESNAFLRASGLDYDAAADAEDRAACLQRLSRHPASAFEGDKGRQVYDALEGKSSLKELGADLLSGPLSLFGLGERAAGLVAPDMPHYWNPDEAFGSAVRWRLTEPLLEALAAGDDVLLLSHSLGSIIAYDVLWKFSYYGEYQALRRDGRPLETLVTMGSPLGDRNVQSNLKGARAQGRRRYPTFLRRWVNIAAEDDYISHDETVGDDFRRMEAMPEIESITDVSRRIYNLSVRNGASNPHHGAGYLIHPAVSRLVADWLR